jgi:tricorn protease
MASKNLTNNDANDAQPMWRGNTIYFLSDRDKVARNNIWAMDATGARVRQVTTMTSFDITFPSMGGNAIVFQAGGHLYLLDLQSEKTAEVPVTVTTDSSTLRARVEKAASTIQSFDVGPSGERAVFEARGDVLTVPAEYGPIINLTRSSGVAERYPRWSPNGQTMAYWSDRSGEYELTLRAADGSGTERVLTKLGAGFRYPPQWSPDSTKIAFADQTMKIRIIDVASGALTNVDQSVQWLAHPALEGWRFQWSADSRWLTWSRPPRAAGNNAIYLFDTKNNSARQVTSAYLNDQQPTFDPEGKFLYYASERTFAPVYSTFDSAWAYANATRIIAVPLRKDVKSPVAARNNFEPAKPVDPSKAAGPVPAADEKPAEPAAPKPVDIDLDGFEARGVILPIPAGGYADLKGVTGKVVYRRLPRAGSSDDDSTSPVVAYDFESRKEATILDDADVLTVTADGKKALVATIAPDDIGKSQFAIIELKPGQKIEKPLAIADLEVPVDPRAEWRQMFQDAARFERDLFYDPGMHGVDWAEVRGVYLTLIDQAVTRWDVNFVLGELIAELNASHTYRSGGDLEQADQKSVGMLGVDWEKANNAWRIKRIVRGGPWDADARSPLDEPGVNAKDGEYVLAVNGVPMNTQADPWSNFQGLGGKTAVLTLSSTPSRDGARDVTVTCLGSEVELRYRAWIEERRQQVDQATKGRVGYIYVQSTGTDAQNELMRQFMAQWDKDGLVIDERFNSGGQIPDRFIELLNRPTLAYFAVRDGESWQWPPVGHRGPSVMLINGWSGSGGDAFPTYFKEAGLGPLIGMRTWGGLIGISGAPALVDGGGVTVPTFRQYSPQGQWFAEGHGVEPDIRVPEDPTELAKGHDTQLQRAIDEVMKAVAAMPPAPAHPPYQKRIGGGGGQ